MRRKYISMLPDVWVTYVKTATLFVNMQQLLSVIIIAQVLIQQTPVPSSCCALSKTNDNIFRHPNDYLFIRANN